MANELRATINFNASNHAPFNKLVEHTGSSTLSASYQSRGSIVATSTPASLTVSTAMTSTRGQLILINRGSVAVKVGVLSSAAFRVFGELEVGGPPMVLRTSATADIQVSTASSTAQVDYVWIAR